MVYLVSYRVLQTIEIPPTGLCGVPDILQSFTDCIEIPQQVHMVYLTSYRVLQTVLKYPQQVHVVYLVSYRVLQTVLKYPNRFIWCT